MSVRRSICTLIVLLVMGAATSLDALNVPTHRLVNRAAAGDGTPDGYLDVLVRYLRESLGLEIETNAAISVTVLRALELLAEGGEREDDGSRFSPKARFHRHFHNPLLPWNEAGLRTRYPFHLLPHQYTSSIRWMQTENQAADDGGSMGGEWSWQYARRLHYEVLTTDDAREREAKAADLFRALGQIMHLVVDASVPEHVRSDAHPFGTLAREVLRSRTAGNYEYWVSDQQARLGDTEFTRRYLAGPIGPNALTTRDGAPPGEAVARVPVARLLDTDRYRPEAPDPNVTLSGPIGIAEFANANFFSEDTVPVTSDVKPEDRPFPFPRREDLVRRSDLAPLSPRIRAYLRKPAGHGLPTAFALAECRFEGRAAVLPPYPCMDEAVWMETATHMLPRAVGYARGVLDYFFRGSLRVRRLHVQVGATVIEIENQADEAMEGVFEVFARQDHRTSHEGREKRGMVNHGAPATIAPGAIVTLPITLLPGQPTAAHLLVFRGRIGLEQEAVAGQVFTVPHVVIVQTTYAAEMRESCQSTFQKSRHLQTCQWWPNPHIVEGELIADLTSPVVASVTATTPLAGRPQLELDGVVVAGTSWTRSGDERNPRRFRITFSGNPHGLALRVGLVNGTIVSTPLMTLIMAGATAEKAYTTFGTGTFGENPPWWAAAKRTAGLRVTTNPSYRTVSINGYAYPTNEATDRYGIDALQERIIVSQITSETSYFQRWVDYASVLTTRPPGGAAGLEAVLRAEFDALAVGSPPRIASEAVLERVYDPAELELLKTFVTGDPPPLTFTAVGRLPVGAGAE